MQIVSHKITTINSMFSDLIVSVSSKLPKQSFIYGLKSFFIDTNNFPYYDNSKGVFDHVWGIWGYVEIQSNQK